MKSGLIETTILVFIFNLQLPIPGYSAVDPRLHLRQPTAILKGGEGDAEFDRAYPIIEKRMGEWFESRPEDSLPPTSALQYGPSLQQAYYLMAIRAANDPTLSELQKKRSVESFLRRGLRLHPNLKWEFEAPAASQPDFFHYDLHRPRRGCLVLVNTGKMALDLMANGFNLGDQRSIRLAANNKIRLWSRTKEGKKQSRPLELKCRGPGIKKVKLKKPEYLPSEKPRTSFYLVAPRSQKVHFFLFSPNAGLDEIPLRHEVKVADFLDKSSREEIPVATDGFLNLFAKHEAAERMARAEGGPEKTELVLSPPPNSDDGPQVWYRDWRFWAVSGAVAAIAISSLVIHRDNSVQSQGGMAVMHF